MKQNILHIGLDIDDTQYHGSALNQPTGEILDFKCRPNLKGLLGQLDKLHKYFPGNTFKYVMKRLILATRYNVISLKMAIIVMSLLRPAFTAPVENKSKLIVLMQHNWCNSVLMIC